MISELLSSGTVRRAGVLIVSALAMVLHKKLGIELDTADKAGLTAIVVAYLAGSNYKEAVAAKAEAEASKIITPEDAVKEINK